MSADTRAQSPRQSSINAWLRLGVAILHPPRNPFPRTFVPPSSFQVLASRSAAADAPEASRPTSRLMRRKGEHTIARVTRTRPKAYGHGIGLTAVDLQVRSTRRALSRTPDPRQYVVAAARPASQRPVLHRSRVPHISLSRGRLFARPLKAGVLQVHFGKKLGQAADDLGICETVLPSLPPTPHNKRLHVLNGPSRALAAHDRWFTS
jgi:hypothetical protein